MVEEVKLPVRREYATQALTTVSPGVYSQQDQARQQMAKAIGNEALRAQEIVTEYQVDKAQVDLSNQMTDWMEQYGGKDYFSADDVRELGVSGIALENPDGTERNDIPAYEVLPRAFSDQVQKTISTTAAGISAPGKRKTWEQNARMAADNQQQKINLNAAKSVAEYTKRSQLNDMQESIRVGNFGIAHGVISNMSIDPVEKKELHKHVRKAQEFYQLNGIADDYLLSNDPRAEEVLDETIAVLRSDQRYGAIPNNELTKDERNQWIGKLNAARKQKNKLDEDAKAQRVDNFWRGFLSNPFPTVSDLPDWLPASDRKSAFSYIANGGNVVTDETTWSELNTLAATDPAKFMDVNLGQYRGRLDASDYRAIGKLQNDLRAGLITGGDIATAKSQVDNAKRSLDISFGASANAEQNAQAVAFDRLVANQFNAKRKELGRDLTQEERTQVLDTLVVDAKVTKKRGGVMGTLFGDKELTYTMEDVLDNVGEQDLDKIQRALIEAGLPVTPATIMQTWDNMQD